MNSETFVEAVRETVYKGAVRGTLRTLEHPPGRRPDPAIVRVSEWYNSLSQTDRENVAKAVDMAAELATYSFLLLLDGLAFIEPPGPKGKLELFYDNGKKRILLNDFEAEGLTALFKDV